MTTALLYPGAEIDVEYAPRNHYVDGLACHEREDLMDLEN